MKGLPIEGCLSRTVPILRNLPTTVNFTISASVSIAQLSRTLISPATQGARTLSMGSQMQSSQGSSARGRGRQVAAKVYALTLSGPEEDALLVEGMILVYST